SLPDLRRILAAVGIGALGVPALLAVLRLGFPVPRSVYLLSPLLLIMMMSGSRLAYRAWKEGHFGAVFAKPDATPVLVLGAGAAAAALLKELATNGSWRVVGLLDDNPRRRGAELLGVKVLGRIEQVGEVAGRMEVRQAIIAMPSASNQER